MRIQTLTLQASRLDELAAFYAGLMELPVKTSGEGITITAGQSNLIFQAAPQESPFYHFAFTIPANKIGEAREWMQQRVPLLWMEQYKSDIADFVNWNAKSIYFFDPAGNIVELIARFDLDNASNEPFSSNQVLSISEAGLIVEQNELDKRTQALINDYDLTYFAKQPPLAHFKALGDDEGLFIVVPENRAWFPTDKIAGIFPMEIYFDGKHYNL
jgi:catechol-2,3-dioxygenase